MSENIHLRSQVSEITDLLLAWAGGDRHALDVLTPRIYRELRRSAAGFMKGERPGNALQATELVNGIFLGLIDVQNVDCMGKAHFFAICAQIMRRILGDAAVSGCLPNMAEVSSELTLTGLSM